MRSNTLRNTLAMGALMAVASPVAAQESTGESILTPGEVDALVSSEVEAAAVERSALVRFLEREEVASVAGAAGIDIGDVRSAAGTLTDEEVRRLAPRVRLAEEALAGGDTIVISSTVVIIGLLVLILILVA